MPQLDVLDLNLKYSFEDSKRTDNSALNSFTEVRNGLMKEIIESFGYDMEAVK